MTRFHLVRHGAHDLLGRVLAGRMDNVPINAAGVAQSARLAEHFAALGIDALYASPMQRARETAAPIAARCGAPLRIEPGLHEVDFGAWTGLTFDALAERADWRAFNRFRTGAPVPGGEAVVAVQARMVETVMALGAAHPDGQVVLVSHADPLKTLVAWFLGMPLELMDRLELEPAAVSILDYGTDWARVSALNCPLNWPA